MIFYNPSDETKTHLDFETIKITLASPEMILRWSYGEVTKQETINYRTLKPERGGLFCEKIFGPVKDYECNCGRYKGIKYKGVVCEKCGVEVTVSKVRRERMGHIELAVPVAHIWFYKVVPSRIGILLDLTKPQLQSVLYYENYIVTQPGDTPLTTGQLLSPDDYAQLQKEYKGRFVAQMGAEAIYELLKRLDLNEMSKELKKNIATATSEQKKSAYLKKLRVVEAFRNSENRPEWMILKVLPVIPPDLRPLVPIEGGRYATSDINDLYRRVITRNNRLKNLMEISAPEIILRNEKRMLQEAVDALLDNGRLSRPIKGRGNRPLKSLSDALKGKTGRFRQNLLGKRVDYSGRSVITVDPNLKIYQCGLPKVMALELFKPFIMRKLEEERVCDSLKKASEFLQDPTPKVWEILEEVVKDHPVLLNRAPTLHRLSIQAFLPKLVDGKAIRIHPLLCPPFNADFDGDQMAVHVPLSFHSQIESYVLMLAPFNILSPASGLPIAAPTQDMVGGIYYLTTQLSKKDEARKYFDSFEDVEAAIEAKIINVHSRIMFKYGKDWIETTAGRVLFNEVLPEGLRFKNKTLGKKDIQRLILECYKMYGTKRTAELLDSLKEIGFKWATIAGVTIGIDDLLIPEERKQLIEKAKKEQEKWNREYYEKGTITDRERYNQIIEIWNKTTKDVEVKLKEKLAKDKDGLNPIFIMANSGARGNWDQVRQLSGMRGLMSKPQKRVTAQSIIETPILNSLKEGLTVVEYFISSHGARKGLTDTALKTSEAGYLTRKLVDVAHDVVVTMEDCGTVLGREVSALVEGGKTLEELSERILGRFTVDDIYHPVTGEILVNAGEEITEEIAKEIQAAGIEKVKIRDVLTCEAKRGVCQKCYGRDLATGRLVEIGEAVGVIAAQSIGEPGTQLTLRTFHVGGVAELVSEQSEEKAEADGVVKLDNVYYYENKGRRVVLSRNGLLILSHKKGSRRYSVPYGADLRVLDGEEVKEGDTLYKWDPYSNLIIAEQEGIVKYEDIITNITMKEVVDETTGMKQPMVIEEKTKTYHPAIHIVDSNGKKLGTYSIPSGAFLLVKDKSRVKIGDTLAKLLRESAKTRDITAGLPRVAELFEAKTPQNKAIISEIDGIVRFGDVKRGVRTIYVEGDTETRVYQVPYRKYVTVHDGQRIQAGDKLCEGSIDPHDVIRVKGVLAAQEFLLNEIQEVYRLQNVKIDDKHIGLIVRQMFKKVRIEDPGDTKFIEGEIVNKDFVQKTNQKAIEKGEKPATFQAILLGITKASLSTDSFISAASFQETTRVLTDAAIQGKIDELTGLKENVIIGNKIPAGTGFKDYTKIVLKGEKIEEETKTGS
uniref:DNA-directed RNA polymerase subunit beta' n=1 Tax=candidate division WOR-3 bacterium TaxID=2052148 RepID=A0A7C4YFH9_UNCW3